MFKVGDKVKIVSKTPSISNCAYPSLEDYFKDKKEKKNYYEKKGYFIISSIDGDLYTLKMEGRSGGDYFAKRDLRPFVPDRQMEFVF